jgi:hypothetical protein
MSRFQVLPLPINSYSIATFSAGTALMLTTLLLFSLRQLLQSYFWPLQWLALGMLA